MALEQSEKELVAIGASVGALCGPCLEHHIPAGRAAGLTETQLAKAVEVAAAVHRQAVELMSVRSHGLLQSRTVRVDAPSPVGSASREDVLASLGASIGSNCHVAVDQHITAALELGLAASQVRSAIKMSEIVQGHAAEITAARAATTIARAAPQVVAG